MQSNHELHLLRANLTKKVQIGLSLKLNFVKNKQKSSVSQCSGGTFSSKQQGHTLYTMYSFFTTSYRGIIN